MCQIAVFLFTVSFARFLVIFLFFYTILCQNYLKVKHVYKCSFLILQRFILLRCWEKLAKTLIILHRVNANHDYVCKNKFGIKTFVRVSLSLIIKTYIVKNWHQFVYVFHVKLNILWARLMYLIRNLFSNICKCFFLLFS